VNWTDPSPCPLAGDANDIHGTSLLADQVHSRVVSIRIVPVPPSGVNVTRSDAACTWHFGCDGRVIVSLAEPQAVRKSSGQRSVTAATACRKMGVPKVAPEFSNVCGR
jgi:hypothetical protein